MIVDGGRGLVYSFDLAFPELDRQGGGEEA
jgi:hypothetical protein